MKMDLVQTQETTFLTAQKDLFKIVQKFINNEKLKKLLFVLLLGSDFICAVD